MCTKNETVDYNEAVAASLEVADMTAINTDMRSFPDFPGSDIPQQSYSVQMEPPSLSFQFRKPRHMHLPESGRRRQKTGVQYHLWRYRMAAMTAEPASRFIITAMLPEHQTPGFGTGWAFPIKERLWSREHIGCHIGSCRSCHHSRCHKK